MSKNRPCERCGAEEDDYDSKPDTMCTEVQMAFGVLAWLCFDCRKKWHQAMKSQILSKQYSEASLRFEHWKLVVAANGSGTIDDGIRLWQNLDALELKLNNFSHEWLIQDVGENSPNSNSYEVDED